ncbi:MAG: type IIA DNA topoisomerase subunit B [Deltaproteobacteria bacterium]|nr:type IIA DNA topoisomerase subunit B [Deltaproteobacteria bacterium]
MRPGMYIGRLGDGSQTDDGIYMLAKEVIDNSVDEFMMGSGKKIEVSVEERSVTIRDYGRGIPHGKVIDCVAKINTGAKYDEGAFYRSVGLNGVGTKAVNALSDVFVIESFRDGQVKRAEFAKGELVKDDKPQPTKEKNGTRVHFVPDETIFRDYRYDPDMLEEKLWNYAYLNHGLKLEYNGKTIYSDNGLLDLLTKEVGDGARYEIVHVVSDSIEYALTHTDAYGESYQSFVNGQYTHDGGTHQAAFREGVLKAFKDFFKKDIDASDARGGIAGTVLVRIHEPVFESQTKTKLGSTHVTPDGPTIRSWVVDFVRDTLVKHLHKYPQVADEIQKKIRQNEKERKELAGIKKLANERQKKANVHNKKLRDCKAHYCDDKGENRESTQLFITEGDSASGSLTKARNVLTQAVFSLRGKPLNCFGLSKKVVYQNEELNLLQHALGIEDDLDQLRYNQVIVATDADVDGMHIRLLLLTFFLQFFPELVRKGHVHILQTPLFRVRNKKETIYCYSETEKMAALEKLGRKAEITRFKGLGEISPDEFGDFIGAGIRLDRVTPHMGDKHKPIKDVLNYFMGKNTPERRDFITSNLVIEPVDLVGEADDEAATEAVA